MICLFLFFRVSKNNFGAKNVKENDSLFWQLLITFPKLLITFLASSFLPELGLFYVKKDYFCNQLKGRNADTFSNRIFDQVG